MLQNEFVAEFSNLNRVSGPGQFTRVLNFSTVRISASFSTKMKRTMVLGGFLTEQSEAFIQMSNSFQHCNQTKWNRSM